MCDSTLLFLRLVDVSDVGNDKLMIIYYLVGCSLHVHCIIGLEFCHGDMSILRGECNDTKRT